MAHIQTKFMGLWKPQNLSIDKISSQKMFIENIDVMEEFGTSMMSLIDTPVASIDELRAIDTTDANIYKSGKMIVVGMIGIYRFNRTTEATDNNYSVVTPSIGVGRWILIGSNTNINEEDIEFTTPSTLTNLVNGETLSKALGKLSKLISEFITHTTKTNPHNITASTLNALENTFSNNAISSEDALMTLLDNTMSGMSDRTIRVIGVTFTAKCGLFAANARTIMTIHKGPSGYGNITAIVCSSARPEVIMRSWAAGVYSEWVSITNPAANTVAEASITE